MKHDTAQATPAHGPIDDVMRYHRRTKHHFDRFAPGPTQLDWANQPDPFRRYEGAALIANGLAGGACTELVATLGIRDASGSVLDHLYIITAEHARERLGLQ